MKKFGTRCAIAGLFAGCSLAWSAAVADMGTAPGGPGSVYGSIDASYVNTNAPSAFKGASRDIEADDGFRLGGSLGVVLSEEVMGLATERIEVRGSLTKYFLNNSIAGTTSINSSATGLPVVIVGLTDMDQRVTRGDLEFSFKGDVALGDGAALTLGVTPFFQHVGTSSRIVGTVAGAAPIFTASSDAASYGAMLTVQPELQLRGGFAVVGDLSVGAYGYNGWGFFTDILGTPVSSNISGVGFRGRGMAGLKLGFAEGVTATLFGGAEYWSDVVSAETARGPGDSANLITESALEFVGGVSFSAALGSL